MAIKVVFFSLFFYLLCLLIPSGKLAKRSTVLHRLTIFNSLNKLLFASNINKYIPFMNISWFISLVIFIFFFCLYLSFNITNNLFVSILVGIMAGYLPKIFLDILIIINAKQIKKNYLSFLNIFYGFYGLNDDIIGAFRRTIDYLNEPLKSYISRVIFKYDKSFNIDFSDCLDELERSIKDKDFAKFLQFTKIHLAFGGDFKKTLEKLIEHARRMEEVRTDFASSAVIGIGVILFMSVLNLGGLIGAYIFNPDVAYFLKNTFLGYVFVLVDLIAVGVGYYIAADFYKG